MGLETAISFLATADNPVQVYFDIKTSKEIAKYVRAILSFSMVTFGKCSRFSSKWNLSASIS